MLINLLLQHQRTIRTHKKVVEKIGNNCEVVFSRNDLIKLKIGHNRDGKLPPDQLELVAMESETPT